MTTRLTGDFFTFVKNFVGLLLIGGFFYYLWNRRDEIIGILDVSIESIAMLCLLILLTWIINGYQSYILYREATIPVTIIESIILSLAGAFGNYLPMRLGTVIRARYLKKCYGFGYASFGGLVGLRALLSIMASGVLGICILIYINFYLPETPIFQLVIIFSALIVMPTILIIFPVPKFVGLPNRIKNIWYNFIVAFKTLRERPKVVLILVLILISQYLVVGLRFVISASTLNIDISIAFILMMAPLATLMSFMSLTPGGIGLREAVMGFVTLSLGESFSQGVFIGSIDRVILLAMISIFGSFSLFTIWKKV